MKNKKDSKIRAKLKTYERYGHYTMNECSLCGADRTFYYDRFDSFCCVFCDEWLDETCNDPNCPFCSKRPEAPLEALWFEQERNDLRKDWRRKNYQHKNAGQMRHGKRKALYAELQDECKDL